MTNTSPPSPTNPWFSGPEPGSRFALRLFCFPYAGGGAPIFRIWPKQVPPEVEICPVHLPGRGRRLPERPYRQIEPLVRAIAPALAPQLGRPFAFFGHSMGALIAYDLARLLRREYALEPAQLFVSGCRAPHIPDTTPTIFNLPEPEFLEALVRMGGTDPTILENAEILKLMLPVLRADFEIVETYRYVPDSPLGCPVTVFGGLTDPEASREQLEEWRQHTTAPVSLHMLPGDHFFLHKSQDQFFRLLAAELTGLTGKIRQG